MSPIHDRCGQYVSEKKWHRHITKRCQKRMTSKAMKLDIGFSYELGREPKREGKPEVIDRFFDSDMLTAPKNGWAYKIFGGKRIE